MYALAPITVREALAWVAETHRHLPRLQGALFATSAELGGHRVGVGLFGNPPRVWQGTGRGVITRCAVLDGRSLRAAGFVFEGWTKAEEWGRKERSRETVNSERKGRRVKRA